MKIAIIGTGGVGGYFGGKLANEGNDVTFLARGEHLKAMQSKGLTVKSILEDFHVDDIKATDKITELEKPDFIIIGVKAWQIKEVRDDLKKIVHAGSMILPLQNGVLASDELSEAIDRSLVLGGLCQIISKIESPGVINHFGIEPLIVFGELDKTISPRVRQVQKLLESADINARISKDIESDLWKKFIGICVGGLLAVTRTTYGELRQIKETRKMMTELLKEIYLLSQKIGIEIEPLFVEEWVTFVDTFPYESTSSLTRDIWEGKPSELEYQNGTVVKLGKEFDVETPINRFIYNSILPSELKARGEFKPIP